MMQYMEHSTKENAKTEDLQRLHEMVTAIKEDGEVGLAYMKNFEIEARIRREGKAEGKAEDILDLLCELGEVPLSVQDQITLQKDEHVLRRWLKLAAKAESVQDFAQKALAD